MSRTWNVATAKAELSKVLRGARREPQVIERRGEPVAVVIGIEQYKRLSAAEDKRRRWQAFIAFSERVREEAGVELELPPRRSRPSPFKQR